MKITTKGRYGLRAIINLASSYYNRPVSIKTIAKEEDISPEFLEQIFFRLKKAGIIESLRGPGGGFMLKQKPSEISIKDIFVALEESTSITPCAVEDCTKSCKRENHCMVTNVWKELSEQINDYLSKVTIKSILEDNGKKFYEDLSKEHNFSI